MTFKIKKEVEEEFNLTLKEVQLIQRIGEIGGRNVGYKDYIDPDAFRKLNDEGLIGFTLKAGGGPGIALYLTENGEKILKHLKESGQVSLTVTMDVRLDREQIKVLKNCEDESRPIHWITFDSLVRLGLVCQDTYALTEFGQVTVKLLKEKSLWP